MEFILKIKTKFDCMLCLNNLKNQKLEKNKFLTLKINIKENENLTILVEPLIKSENLILPYNIYVKNLNNTLQIESGNINVFSFKNKYLITLEKLEVVKNMKVLLSGQNFSVFNTFCTNITMLNNTINLKDLFEKVESQKISNNTILCFDNKYALVFNGQNKVLFNDYYDQISIKNGSIDLLTNVYDIAKHSILTKISGNNVTKNVVYQHSHPHLVSSKKIIPIAFLQALKIDNENLAKHYLTQHLKDISSLKNLKSFFGDFCSIELDGDDYVLFYKDKTHKIFSFEFSFDKISKINVF